MGHVGTCVGGLGRMYKVGASLDEAEVRGRLLLGEEGESDSVSLTLGTPRPPLSLPLTLQVNTSGRKCFEKDLFGSVSII